MQETPDMSTNEKGSDLDVFEGLSKKGASSAPPGSPSVPSPPRVPEGANRTLLGMTAPASLGAPPPPPGRTALPPVDPASPSLSGNNMPAAKPGVDVDWDDEDEATHIFDKAEDAPRLFPAPTPAAGAPPSATGPSATPYINPSLKTTLLGMSPPTQPGYPSPTGRFTPPPPPPGAPLPRSPLPPGPGSLPPPALGTLPPPPTTLQGLGAASRSMPMPPSLSSGGASPPLGTYPMSSTIPPGMRAVTAADQPTPPRPNTELTALLRPARSPAAVWVIAGLAAAVVLGAVLLLMPRTGRVVINVTDPRGSTVGRVDIFVDGRKQCDTAPCIVEQLSSGTHDVKVLADGYDTPPVQSVNVESRRDAVASFALGSASRGTGLKVSGTQPGVKLYLDDREIGPLPQDLRDVSPGEHVVKLVGSERYQPLERRVTIPKDAVEDLGTLTLKVLKGKATVSLGTPGARVFLVNGTDRRELPMLPISVDIDTTKMWALQAIRPGYNDYNQAISFDDGQAEKTYVVTLEPRTGPAPQAQWGAPAPVVQAPQYQAPVQQAAPPPAPRPAPAPAPAPAPVAAAAPAAAAGGEGFLNINSLPPSNCFLDGKPLGATPRIHVPVSAGTHQVKFVNTEQQLTGTKTVTVVAGQTAFAILRLTN
ncbi:MAG: hypothetical protein JOZ69_12535 [Myxococcales bacterium]|nr:hypothetical protein [Myxococcales bacterium]